VSHPLEAYEIPLSDLEQTVLNWVEEAIELRFGDAGDPEGKLVLPDYTSTVADFSAVLLRVVTRADRVDELLAKVRQVKGRAARIQTEARFEAERALDQARSQEAGRRVEFSTGREREANASLASFTEKRKAHQAQRLVDLSNEAYDVINQAHWGLDAIRKDIRGIIRSQQFESTLER
jgi:hypothetical protein